jgi:hypothetical protein
MKCYQLKILYHSLGLTTLAAGLAACGSSSSVNYLPLNYTDNTILPPYYQAIDFSRNLVTEDDLSTLVSVNYMTQTDVVMPDSRSDTPVTVSAYIFIAHYEVQSINIYVNPEFGNEAAAEQVALYYAEVIGRIPQFLREGVDGSNRIDTVYLHQGFEPLVGADNSLIIYSDNAAELSYQGILEEVIIREAAHVSLDAELAGSEDWNTAQIDDGIPISQLAYNLVSEDAAETILAWIATSYRYNRLSQDVDITINGTIYNRLNYLNFRGFSAYPIDFDAAWDDSKNEPVIINQDPSLFAYYAQWEQQLNF